MEIWKDIKNYEGYYQISNYGRIRSLDRTITNNEGKTYFKKGIILKQTPHSNKKYKLFQVYLCKNNGKKSFKIHRLVALHFVNNPLNKKVVNHIDNNPLNNHYKNLEWVTIKENVNHALKYGNMGINVDDKTIIELYKKTPLYKIAKKYKSSCITIKNILIKNNIKIRSLSESQLFNKNYDVKLICDLYKDGYSVRKIANYLNLGDSSITRILNKNNIKKRSYIEANIYRNKELSK